MHSESQDFELVSDHVDLQINQQNINNKKKKDNDDESKSQRKSKKVNKGEDGSDEDHHRESKSQRKSKKVDKGEDSSSKDHNREPKSHKKSKKVDKGEDSSSKDQHRESKSQRKSKKIKADDESAASQPKSSKKGKSKSRELSPDSSKADSDKRKPSKHKKSKAKDDDSSNLGKKSGKHKKKSSNVKKRNDEESSVSSVAKVQLDEDGNEIKAQGGNDRRKEIIKNAINQGELNLIDFSNVRGEELQRELEKQNKAREARMVKYMQFEKADSAEESTSEHLDDKIATLQNEMVMLKDSIKKLLETPDGKDDKDANTVDSKAVLLRKKDWLAFKSLELEHLFDATGYKYEMLEKKHKAMHEALKHIESVKTDMKKIIKYRSVLNKLQAGLAEAEGVILEMQNMAYNLLPANVSRHCKNVEETRKRLIDMQDDLMEKKHFAKKELIITKKEIVAINQAIMGEEEATKLLEARKAQELQRLINYQAKNAEIDEIIESCNGKLDLMNLTLEEAQEMAMKTQVEMKKLRTKSIKDFEKEEVEENIKGHIKEEKIKETKQMNKMMKEQIANIEAQIKVTEEEIAKNEVSTKKGMEITKILEKISKATGERRILAEKLQTERVLRKTYFNQIEDMKGAIKVYCRVRPISKTESQRHDEICVDFPDMYTVVIKQPDKKNPTERNKEFLFDRVFGVNSTQIEIFKEIDRLIEVVFTGFNVCIFAYGQTGSGKTFTLIGDMDSKEHMGVVPRAFIRFYDIIESNKQTTETDTNFYMIELYNDKLLDLMKSDAEYSEKLKIVKNEHGMVIVPGVTMLNAKSTADMVKYFHHANNNRHIAATKMNSESSRSHLILTIMFTFTNKLNKKKFFGKISMVDLAGSERLAKSGVSGINQIEATSINKALTALGDVISALTTMNKGFVPYRNNKLTQLMQDSLGGTAKTLLIVNLSPVSYNSLESINSLNYATRMKTIVNENLKVADDDEVKKLKDIITKLLRGEPVVIN